MQKSEQLLNLTLAAAELLRSAWNSMDFCRRHGLWNLKVTCIANFGRFARNQRDALPSHGEAAQSGLAGRSVAHEQHNNPLQ